MATKVDIYNLALANVASKSFIQNITEDSVARKTCDSQFQSALDTVLEDHDWGFASDDDALVVIRESSDTVPPPKPWIYEYAYPSEAIFIREIIRDTDNEKEVPFDIGIDDNATGKVIFSDKKEAVARYTRKITNVGLLSPRAAEAVGWKLATLIAIPLTHNLKLKASAETSYTNAISQAKASNLNEKVNRTEPEPTGIQARA